MVCLTCSTTDMPVLSCKPRTHFLTPTSSLGVSVCVCEREGRCVYEMGGYVYVCVCDVAPPPQSAVSRTPSNTRGRRS